MEEEKKELQELNREPEILLTIPQDDGQGKVFSVTRKKARALACIFAVAFAGLAGAAGFYGWQYHHSKIDKTAYQEYLDHKAEQEAKLRSLLEDNEKMLRDMSEIHTLETKLRRAVIQNSGDREFTSSLDSIGATPGVKSTDPAYSGKGGPGADITMLDVAAAQNKNLTAQIDRQKKNMHELLTIIEGRNNRLSILPDYGLRTAASSVRITEAGRVPLTEALTGIPVWILPWISVLPYTPRRWERWRWPAGTAATGSL